VQEFPVKPLDTPQPEAKLLIDSVDSVKLFHCRAEELGQPISEEHLLTVAELCRMLDGIPLAIELAAARLMDLSPQEILSRIKEQLPLQVDKPTDTFDPRHQKLQNVLSWSYDLLTEREQELFAQLSVFSGGFFTEAAEKICTGTHILGNMFSLRSKSLMQTEIAQNKKRYFLLEPIRQYAAEKLEGGERIKKAHAKYFYLWAKEQDEKLKGAEQSQTLSEMALELDNFRSAMDFAHEQGGWKLLGELGVALSRFFEIRGLWSEGIQRLGQAEEALRSLSDKALLANALYWLGRFYQFQGDYETAQNLDTESLQIKRELGDKWGIPASLNNLGNIAVYQGTYDEARQLYTESLKICRELGDKWDIAGSLNNLGAIAVYQGDYNEARQLNIESLKIYRELGNKDGIAASLNNLGLIAGNQGSHHEAQQLHTESLKIYRELGNKRGIAISLGNLGEIARCQGAYDEARQFLTENLQILRELKDKWCIANSLYQFGKLAEAEGNAAQAVLFLLHATRLHEEMKSANSTDAVEVQEALAEIQKEISTEQFERIKQQADAMSVDEVIELALSWGDK